MQQPQAQLVLDSRALLAEGPCWDHRNGILYWVDIIGMRVHAFHPESGVNRTIQLDQVVGAAVPRHSGGLVAALKHGFHLLDMETGDLKQIADPEADLEHNRFNDGKCDAAGRFWAGTTSADEIEPLGSLYCLEADYSVRKSVPGVIVSNGIGWSPDGKTMYYIDSPTKRIVAYDFEVDSGKMSQPRTVVVIPESGGLPDGMTVDAEGMLWVAHWGGWQISRWNPQTGQQLSAIALPVAQVSSCAFGGADLDELYITTAGVRQSEEELARQPHAGGIFRVKLPVPGTPANFYAG
jgi:sugar lactone lactonase YvrE